ncbi:MAG: sensor histidine kinase [Candidatus Limnocylindrales bacterium]
MTTPTYASSAFPDAPTLGPAAPPESVTGRRAAVPRFVPTRIARLAASPRALQLILDVVGIALSALAFAHTPLSAEFLFHGVFVVLTLNAFLFGRRGTLIRIGIVLLPLLLYADARVLGVAEQPLELSEWPLMFVIAIIVASMADQRKKTSRLYATYFRQASERLLTVQEEERRRIAAELHDGVGQVLTALTLTLDSVGKARRLTTAVERVKLARQLSDTALAETRHLAHSMRPVRSEERGLVPALRDLASQSGFPVEVRADNAGADPEVLGPTATVEVYRIVQEALANAARHSGSARAQVSVGLERDWLTVIVQDDGVGFSPGEQPERGIGIAGMEERATLLGGVLRIDAAPGRGTRVMVSVPTTAIGTLSA